MKFSPGGPKPIESGALPSVEDMLLREAKAAAGRVADVSKNAAMGKAPRGRRRAAASARPASARLERDIERSAVNAIQKRGMKAPKFKTPGRRSAPDRIVFPGGGLCLFLEFKRPGEEPTDLQKLDHKGRREAGYTVGVPTSTSEALGIIDDFMVQHGRTVRND